MNHEEYTHANRRAWNEAQSVQAQTRPYNIAEDIKKGNLHVDRRIFEGVDLENKYVGQFCCNNGRELLSLIPLGAKECVGFDLSDAFVEEADRMARSLGYNCSFIRANVAEIDTHREYFDLLIFTVGTLPWLKDLDRVFRNATGMLKPGGTVIVSEWHPFLGVFAMPGEPDYDADNPCRIAYSYFRKEPIVEDNGMDYVGGTSYKSEKFYSFNHTISEIITAVVSSKLRLVDFTESPEDIMGNIIDREDKQIMPRSFRLTAVKD
ncbi:MAG TPA: class I SAM-dependent methyltransferase [Spirochaetota bacterium]|nr:class I SAM-dependent methyltransferase [Spirochaetota bacterium]